MVTPLSNVTGLAPADQATLTELVNVLLLKKGRNRLRETYYDGKNRLKDLQISLPPQLRTVETVVGWPAKAVDMLAARSIFDGFTFANGETSPQLERVLAQNQFKNLYRETVTSELINSCAFITVSAGKPGEPPVVISAYTAENAAAIWDGRKKRIKAGLAIVKHGQDVEIIYMYTDMAVIEITESGKQAQARYIPHNAGRPLMEPLRYAPSLARPFGKSRISRAVMSITDSAVRAALRTEVAAEFFTTPQKYLLGVDENVLGDMTQWEAYIGQILAIGTNQDGQTPQFGQLSQMTMEPHISYMRSLAARFAGETGIPVSSLGVVSDNPSSAQAIYAAKEDLITDAELLNSTNGESLRNVALLTMSIMTGTPVNGLPDDALYVAPRFKNPAIPSVVSQADAMSKMIAAIPWLAETDVALEEFGFSDDQLRRLQSDRRRIQARERIQAVMASQQANRQPETEPSEPGTGQNQEPLGDTPQQGEEQS